MKTTKTDRRLLFLALNARYTHSNPAVYSLKNYITSLPYEVTLLQRSINSPMDELLESILRTSSDILALSVYIWNSSYIQRLIKRIREESPSITIICGGPEAGYNSSSWFKPGALADYVIKGAGEQSLYTILSQWPKPGVYQEENKPFNDLPFLYTDDDLKELQGKYIYYESSRGCPFNCTYCLSSRSDEKLTYRDVEKVTVELSQIMKHQPLLVKFVDRTFNLKKNHYQPIWKYIIEQFHHSRTTFHFEIDPHNLDKSDFGILHKVPRGLFQFEAGIQSIHSSTLEAVKRKPDASRALEICRKIVSLETIHLHVDQIVGLPGESFKMSIETFNALYHIGADHIQVGFLKVLPGTELEEESERLGIQWQEEVPYTVLSTDSISPDEIELLSKVEHLVHIYYNSGKFFLSLKEIIQQFSEPFLFFQNLNDYIHKNDIPSSGRWEDQASLLLSFASEKNIDSHYILDCLAHDWLTSTRDHRLPKLLHHEEYNSLKKHFLNNRELYVPEYEYEKRDAIIIPKTEHFKKSYGDVLVKRKEKITSYYL